MRKNILLVAGYEYKNGRTNMALLCKKRANAIIHQRSNWRDDPSIFFTLFDVKNGTIERGTLNNGAIQWNVISSNFDAINRSIHYTSDDKFIQQQTNVLSIIDVYQHIQEIGRNHPNTIHELSIVGHGWRGGPVLVNSYERLVYKHTGNTPRLRDPWDKDGRKKDTNVTNMNTSQWRNFKNAFHNQAHIWVWGCASSRVYKTVINKVLSSSEFRRKRYGRHEDDDTFTLSFSSQFANTYFEKDTLFFFRSRNNQTISERRFTRTLREIKDFLIRGLCHTYAAQMAYNTKVKVYAALPGTGADYDRETHNRRRVMVVPTSNHVYGYSYASIIRFYKTYVEIQEDSEDKGYALFSPQQIRTWKRR